jgi:hypothetical protein
MAKKSKAKAAKKATRKAAKSAKATKRAGAKKAAKKGAKKAGRTPSRATKSARKAGRKAASRPAKAARPKAAAKSPAARQARKAAQDRTATATGKRPNLDRERRTVQEDVHGVPSSLNMDRTASAARTGRAEFQERLREHTSTGPAMTGGDVDADWEDAEAVGDEAPGGDNPTPDQDVVDEIGRAMGIEYDDDEELKGGDELAERDRHRWELDPASKDDFEEE